MEKYVYLLYGNAYEACIKKAIEQDKNAYSFVPFKNSVVFRMHMFHNARPLNEKKELPFKLVWFRRVLKGMDLDKKDEIYFLLYESFHLSYSRKFLKYLRKQYPKSKLCFMYLNPVTEIINKKVQKILDILNAVITFNEKDAKQYNLVYCQNQPYKIPFYEDKTLPKSDVFFIGADKGRLSKLIAIYEKLTGAGFKCDFHIVGVPEKRQRYRKDIVYNKKISYSEVLTRVNASKCVLEVLQNSEDYLSIRTIEALQYHRKLLTESKSAMKFDFYNPKIIQVFNSPEDIDTDFIKESIDESVYPNDCLGNVQIFHDFLKCNI